MKKIFLSIIISISISFIASSILQKKVDENWEMNLHYEHISRSLNVSYEIAMDIMGDSSENNFVKFVDTLDVKISTPGNQNPCSKARSLNKVPNILLTYDKLIVRVVITNSNKDLILECEKFIDSEMRSFEVNTKNIMKRIIKYKLDTEKPNREINEKRIYDLMAQGIINTQSKPDLSLDDLQQLTTSLMLLDMVTPNNSNAKETLLLDDAKLDALDIITKSNRYIYLEQTNTSALKVSLFIISLSILLFIFHFNQLRKNMKIKRLFKILIK